MHTMTQVLSGETGGVVRRTFALMSVAEEEIARAQRKHPRKRDAINAVFGAACPPEGMSDMVDTVYRSHVRELCERAASGRGLGFVTDAEIMLCLHRGSLRAPLERDHAVLYADLVSRITGRSFELGTPSHEHAVRDLLAEYKKKSVLR